MRPYPTRTPSGLCSPTSPHPSSFSPDRRNPVPFPSAPLLLRDRGSSASRERASGSGSARDVTSCCTQETRHPVHAIIIRTTRFLVGLVVFFISVFGFVLPTSISHTPARSPRTPDWDVWVRGGVGGPILNLGRKSFLVMGGRGKDTFFIAPRTAAKERQ